MIRAVCLLTTERRRIALAFERLDGSRRFEVVYRVRGIYFILVILYFVQEEPHQDCLEFSNDSYHYRERDTAILINLTKVVQNDYICNWMPVEAYYSYPPAFSTLSKRGHPINITAMQAPLSPQRLACYDLQKIAVTYS